ncbi:MAG: AMP-binding protein [Trueperaceae bacterium]|nr:MAG: AMP-binding protein [Trueperaceae bacterium]
MNIAHLLREQAFERAQAVAIKGGRRAKGRSITFAGLEESVARAVTLLAESGLKKGDAVLVFVPLSIELYVALSALFRLGLIAMFVDPSAGRERLEQCCRLYPPKGLIASSKAHLLRIVSPAMRAIPVKFVVWGRLPGAIPWARADRLPLENAVARCGEEHPALLTFTSGSTGLPKAAVRTHSFLSAQYRALAKNLELRAGETDLTTQPIFALANLASGLTSLLPDADLRRPDRIDAEAVVAQIERERLDRVSASPAFLERVLDYAESRRLRFPRLGKILTGGAPVFPGLLERLQALAPRADIIAVYGSTEAEPIAHVSLKEISPRDREAMCRGRGLLAGPPIPDIELRIIRDSWGEAIPHQGEAPFAERCLPQGQVGEIVVSGRHVLHGYLHGRGDEENKFDVGKTRWHRTGDAGYLDERGRLWLLGRCSARIEDEHGTLYPFALECAAHSQATLHRVAAVLDRGVRTLVVEPKKGVPVDTEGLLNALAWAELSGVRVIDRMPVDRRHNAKVDYAALRRVLSQR